MTAETPGVLIVAKNAAPENKPRRCDDRTGFLATLLQDER
jgi:hypothetical protein